MCLGQAEIDEMRSNLAREADAAQKQIQQREEGTSLTGISVALSLLRLIYVVVLSFS